MKKQKIRILKEITVVVMILFLILNVYLITKSQLKIRSLEKNSEVNTGIMNIPQTLNISDDPLSTKGFTKVNISATDNYILLQSDCIRLGLVTSDIQLKSIKQGLQKQVDLRPNIHDIMSSILDNFNITILMVKITDARDDLYFSNIYLRNGNNLLNIDSKPTDAIALAVRNNVPVYVKNNILGQYGEKTC